MTLDVFLFLVIVYITWGRQGQEAWERLGNLCQRVQLVCYRDQSAHEEKAFFESLQMSFDKIKSCGQIFSAIVLLGDFNAHFNRPINYGDTSSPNADIGIRVFIFVATTRSSSRALCWHFVRENVSSPNLRTVLGILTDTADTDACCCYRRLSWWVNSKMSFETHFFPFGNEPKMSRQMISTQIP